MSQDPSTLSQAASQISSWGSLSTLVVAAGAGAVGLLSGWLGAYLKVKGENLATKEDFQEMLRRVEDNTRAVEAAKASVAREVSLDTELREAVRQFTAAAGALVHSMCWLTWDCTARNRVHVDMVRHYDEEAHRFLPLLLSHLAVVAMLNPDLHDRLSPLADSLFSLDAGIGNAVVKSETDLAGGLEELAQRLVEGTELEKRFRWQVANLLSPPSPRTV
jgi:hypothetical protein